MLPLQKQSDRVSFVLLFIQESYQIWKLLESKKVKLVFCRNTSVLHLISQISEYCRVLYNRLDGNCEGCSRCIRSCNQDVRSFSLHQLIVQMLHGIEHDLTVQAFTGTFQTSEVGYCSSNRTNEALELCRWLAELCCDSRRTFVNDDSDEGEEQQVP